jgi:hypothetical protein
MRPALVKSLDRKLARIRSGAYAPPDFIIAYAADADMALGLAAPGPARAGQARAGQPGARAFAPRAAHLTAMGDMVRSAPIDILLASASTIEILAGADLFTATAVTPAVRCNDSTDIWSPRGGRYARTHSRPFRSASLPAVRQLADLGLYSITFCNDADRDVVALGAYEAFRAEASSLGIRHFLEVFNPPADAGLAAGDAVGAFLNDSITRCLAGVVAREQPIFLKVAYNGRRSLEELAAYDPDRLVVGVLGGVKGTTRDTFELLSQAERAGARVALFGRKINYAEDPVALVGLMREVLERRVDAREAVRLYHEALDGKGIPSLLSLDDDIEISDPALRDGAGSP